MTSSLLSIAPLAKIKGATDTMSELSSPLSSPRSSHLSSPLSSAGSRSPTPPADYPSPSSSHESETVASSQARGTKRDAPGVKGHDSQPQKIRKIDIATTNDYGYTTEYLNLPALNESLNEQDHQEQDAKLRKLMKVLRGKRKIVVIAGAGISVSAGIPDFRSSTGLFKTLRNDDKSKASGKHLFDASVYKSDSSTSAFHDMVRDLSELTKKASPTPFHHMLATLAEEGRLLRLYSQNVDGIDIAMDPLKTTIPLPEKGPWPKTIQLHGGLEKMQCTKCHLIFDFEASLFIGAEPPNCKSCTDHEAIRADNNMRARGIGRLRPRMVLYNEFNQDGDAIGAVSTADLKSRPDAVIVVGTSLKVPGTRRLVKEMCAVTRDRRGGFTAWINLDQPPVGIDLKDCWDMVVTAECDDIARYVGLPQYNDKDCGEYQIVDGEKADSKGIAGVFVDSKPVEAFKNKGILTPTDSPRHQSPTPLINMTKMKQPKLLFAPKQQKKEQRPPAIAKDTNVRKPGRKVAPKDGRKPLPDARPKNAITNAFGAAKPQAATDKASKPLKSEPDFPNLGANVPMAQISPFDSRTNKETPRTPTTPVVEIPSFTRPPNYERQAMISPKQIPKGMENLLN